MPIRLIVLGGLVLQLLSCAVRTVAAQDGSARPLESGEHTFERDGMRLWYRASGTGPVCLMPTPAWGPPSDPYFRTLGSMEKLFTIVYLDSRGTGRSGRAKTPGEYTWEHLVGDLEALRAHLAQEEVWLMGHSEGGVQVLQYAMRYPERVSGLVLLSSLAAQDEAWLADMEARRIRRRAEPWYEEASKALAAEPTTDEEMAAMLRASLPFYWSDPSKIEPYADDFAAGMPSAAAAAGSYASRRYPYDLRPRLGSVVAPTLIVVGDDDFVCSPEVATSMHLALQNSKLLLIEQCGHFPWMEQPAVFEKRVPEFLRALGLGDH